MVDLRNSIQVRSHRSLTKPQAPQLKSKSRKTAGELIKPSLVRDFDKTTTIHHVIVKELSIMIMNIAPVRPEIISEICDLLPPRNLYDR